jgi:serine/threonine-protein kinase
VGSWSTAFRDKARKRVGTTLLKKWHLDELLGIGGMAAVYVATHRNGTRCALKILHPFGAPEIAGLFVREGWFANQVGHPSVVRILDDDVAEDGCPFLIMDLVTGSSLDALARKRNGKISVREVMHLADQLLDIVATAHERGIVHGDIKP